MPMLRLYVITCPYRDCRESIVLPRQSLLGRFEHPQCQPSDIWPITYLCSRCKTLSEYSAEMIHPVAVEVPPQNLSDGTLVCHEFDREDDGTKMRIFSRIDLSGSQGAVLERLLLNFGVTGGVGRLIKHYRIE